MKQIFIDNQPTTYYIFEDGRLLNKKTGHYYKGSIRGGYRQFDLRWKGKKQTFSQHRLIAEYYIPNPENLPVIHHIDGNKLNNKISNLQWVTFSENNKKENRRFRDLQITLSTIDESQEEWRSFRDTIYLVSSYGRVKNGKTDKILKGKISEVGYREYTLNIDHKSKTLLAHRITYEVFFNEVPIVINHKDGNKLNNHISNLENVSYLENNLKALYETKTRYYKRTAQYDKEGNLINIYLNNAEAARAMGVKTQSIYAAIKNHYCSCGYYWANLEENDEAPSTIPSGVE